MRPRPSITIAAATVLVVGATILALTALPSSARESSGSAFTGSRQCLACHRSEHETWETMRHAQAFQSLTRDQIRSGKDEQGRVCISCHVTGFWDPMGFASAEETPLLTGVGCEACHGGGKEHIKTMIRATLDEVEPKDKKITRSLSCTRCHNPHISYRKLYGKKEKDD